MLATSVKHGDLMIDMQTDGSVNVVRQSDMSHIILSLTEWRYLLMVAELHGWPIAPPLPTFQESAP